MSEKAGYGIIDGRYEVLSECGKGGSSAVYKVFDRNLGRVLALKELHLDQSVGPGFVWRFKQEFMLTARLRHPHTVSVYDFGVRDEHRYYFTMDFVEGKRIVEWCASRGPDEILALLLQVAIALSYIHGQRVVHGDIKPSNIIVRSKPPAGENLPLSGSDLYDAGFVTLMDFGLSSALSAPSLFVGGTVEYMAPERFVASGADVRSDLYSLGVLAYELFAKRLPFSSETIEGYVEHHMHTKPAPLSSVVPDISPVLSEVVDRLLAKRPAQRPSSASALSASLAEMLGPRVPKTFAITPDIRLNQLFGREDVLKRSLRLILGWLSSASFRQMFDEEPPYSAYEHQDRCLVLLARGAGGSGRSAFLQGLKRELQLCELNAMESPSGAQNLDAPSFLSATLRSAGPSLDLSETPTSQEAYTEDAEPSSTGGLPSTDSPGRQAPDEVGDWSGASRQRLTTRFVGSISSTWQTKPLVWLVDDFDLLDDGCKAALHLVVRSVASLQAGRRVAVVLTGGPAADSDLAGLSDCAVLEKVELLPLGESEIASLVDALFMPNSFSREAASVLLEKTGGLPVFLSRCIESILEEGIVYFSDGCWELRAERLAAFSAPSSLAQVFESRLARISAGAMSILLKAGVLGEPFAPTLIADLGRMSPSAAHEGLEELVRQGLLVEAQTGGDAVSYSLASPVLGQVVAARLSDEERRAIHRLIAQNCDALAASLASGRSQARTGMDQLPPCEPAQLRAMSAIHASYAGLSELLVQNYDVGCGFLLSRLRYAEAKLLSDQMLAGLRITADPGQLEHILFRLGYLNFVLGNHDEAIDVFKEGISLASKRKGSLREEVLAACRLGLVYCGRGKFDEARKLYQALIRRLKVTAKKASEEDTARLGAYLARLHTFLGQTFFAQCDYEKAKAEFRSALKLVPESVSEALLVQDDGREASMGAEFDYLPRLFRNLAIIADAAGHYKEALKFSTNAIRAAKLLGDTSEQGRNLVTHGTINQHLDKYAEAERSYKEALDYFAKEGFKEGLLVVHNNLASILDLRGRPKEAALQCTKALSLARTLGNRYAMARILPPLGSALYQQGWLDEAKQKIDEALELCEQDGFQEAGALSHCFRANVLLAQGDIDGARASVSRALELSKEIDSEYNLLEGQLAEASVFNAEQDFGKASETVSNVLSKAEHLDRRDISWARRLRAEAALGLGEYVSAQRDVSEGLSAARDAGAISEEALCLALFARIKEAQGDYPKAIELANEALKIFKKMEAFLKIGRIAEYLSDLLLRTENRSDALLSLELARDQFAGLDMKEEAARLDDKIETLRWGDRSELERGSLAVKALYKVTRLFESLLDLDELLNRVMDAIIEILGAERGLIMLRDPETGALLTRVARNVDKQTIEDVTRISKSVIQRVVDLGKPLVTTDAQSDPRFHESKSVSLYDIRSIVCVPVVINGEVAGTFYVDSSLSATVFTKQDLYLLSAFAAQASMAIEKAMLLEELQLKKESLQAENIDLREAIAPQLSFDNLVGESGLMQDVFKKIKQVADTQVAVLIEGESGTGKELVARAIHYNGARKDGPFVKINCAAIPENLMENELFGHEKGAFTGADERRIGKFEVADKGSLFLDEIGDLPIGLQAKLLTAIENKEFQRVGGTQTIRVDVRILTATNQNLQRLITQRCFRKDLFYRVNEVPIRLAPLRQRRGDIPPLVYHFIEKYGSGRSSRVSSIEKSALSLLVEYDWPGNVRELESAVKRALIDASGSALTRSCFGFLPTGRPSAQLSRSEKVTQFVDGLLEEGMTLKQMLAVMEEEVLRRAIDAEGWSIRRAAQELGISRNTLKSKLIAFGIEVSGS
ncbi:MAG: sigma 54-interacting transcriptional regulator [Candidatus Coatesbacteria bacterium]|nr:sigma 54-interacting transcriptional regulator [Candidatus Coatesbacteria bacterium]